MIGSRGRQTSSLPGHAGLSFGNIVAPEGVLGGPVDRVVLAGQVVHREAAGERLLVGGLGRVGRVRLAGLRLRLEPTTNSTPAIGSRSPSSVASRK